MSELTMVLQSPEDLLPVSGSGNAMSVMSPSDEDCRDERSVLPSPSSSSSFSSPSSPSTSALSTPPNPNDDNISEDSKATERTPFIDPLDVIGRRVMFDLPPLMLDSGWGVTPEENSCKGRRMLPNANDLPSPEDDIQSTTTNFTNISESDFPKETVPSDDSISANSGQGGGFASYLLDGKLNNHESNPETQLKILSSDEDCTRASLMNGTSPKPKHLKEVVIYDDLCFLHWNWPIIRRACKVTVVSIMIGMLCIAITLIATAPRTCEPSRLWWQGAVIYEVFPASFQDSDGDGIGDIRGLDNRLNYVTNLGVAAIRLNSILESDDYPLKYWTVMNHTSIAPQLGTMEDFESLVKNLHAKNLKIILDFNPVFVSKHHPLVSERNFVFNPQNLQLSEISSTVLPSTLIYSIYNESKILNLSHGYIQQELQNAIQFWLSKGVDGFYVQYLEYLEITPQLLFNLLEWRSILDSYEFHFGRKILICSGNFLHKLEKEIAEDEVEVFTGLFDMVEYQLRFESSSIDDLPLKIANYTARQFFRPVIPTPRILWSVGSSEKLQLANRLGNERAFASVLFQLMLPGTINIFSGDELNHEEYSKNNQNSTVGHLVMGWTAETEFSNFSRKSWLSTVPDDSQLDTKNQTLSLDQLRALIKLRNVSTPLYVAAMLHQGEHEKVMIPNYKIRFCNNGALALERFYPRWSSFVILVNLGEKIQNLDLSSKFYQGKIIISTSGKRGNVVFKNIHLKGGEVLIVKL